MTMFNQRLTLVRDRPNFNAIEKVMKKRKTNIFFWNASTTSVVQNIMKTSTIHFCDWYEIASSSNIRVSI